jgi:hypothetical protein
MRRGNASCAAVLFIIASLSWGQTAKAEVLLSDPGSPFEFYSDGRVGGFVEGVWGQTLPTQFDQNGNLTHAIGDGGVNIAGLYTALPMGAVGQGDVKSTRVRSGFLSNIIGFGVRRKLTEYTTVRGYISIWADIENENERAFLAQRPDVREGYLRIEGPAGSLLVGRSLTLFSRGATEIDFLYAHRYGVGNPAGFDSQGPSGGFVGYGVIASTFQAGVVYSTPRFHGLMLTAGYFDPARFVGLYWDRTELGRPEGEATFDAPLGTLGKIHLFVNGAFQKVYAAGSARSDDVYGVGAGGRLELSVFRLGVAAHSGQGLGFDYAFDGSTAVLEIANTQALRKFDGLYVQTMLALGRVDISAGAGVTRVHEVPGDVIPDPNTGMPATSVLKQRVGIAGGVVYHFTDYLHFDIDYFRASAEWWLGEHQVVNTINSGMTLNW